MYPVCAYCGVVHDPADVAAEHVVPRKIGNRSYTQPGTCARVNRVMEKAVEAPFHKQSIISELQWVYWPPHSNKHPVYIDTLRRVDGSEEKRFLHRGRVTLMNTPEIETTDVMPVILTGRDGRQHSFELKLPFEVMVKPAFDTRA